MGTKTKYMFCITNHNVIHAMKYYLAGEENTVLIHATTCMNLENIKISERSQSQ